MHVNAIHHYPHSRFCGVKQANILTTSTATRRKQKQGEIVPLHPQYRLKTAYRRSISTVFKHGCTEWLYWLTRSVNIKRQIPLLFNIQNRAQGGVIVSSKSPVCVSTKPQERFCKLLCLDFFSTKSTKHFLPPQNLPYFCRF